MKTSYDTNYLVKMGKGRYLGRKKGQATSLGKARTYADPVAASRMVKKIGAEKVIKRYTVFKNGAIDFHLEMDAGSTVFTLPETDLRSTNITWSMRQRNRKED